MHKPVDHPPITLQARSGQALEMVLEALPGAGPLWQAPPAPPGCILSDVDSSEAGMGEGSGRLQHFVLTCAGPGTLTLRFDNKRPW